MVFTTSLPARIYLNCVQNIYGSVNDDNRDACASFSLSREEDSYSGGPHFNSKSNEMATKGVISA